MTCRIVGSQGEATAANFVLPHLDDRITVRDAAGERVERLGTRPTYDYQLEAFAAARARRRPAADRPGRRGGDHGADRRLLPRGRAPAPPSMGGSGVAQWGAVASRTATPSRTTPVTCSIRALTFGRRSHRPSRSTAATYSPNQAR